MVYNYSNLTNLTTSETLFDLVKFTNETNGGLTGVLLVITIFLILLVTFTRRNEFIESLTVTSFITFIITLMLRIPNLINGSYVIFFGLLTGVMAFIVVWQGRR